MKYKVLLFYKYVEIKNPENICEEHQSFCINNDIKGRVFLAEEGVNGTVSGTEEIIDKYKAFLRSYPQFTDIIFKEDPADLHAFRKMHTRVKTEIVNSGLGKVDFTKSGMRLKPEELKNFYDFGKEFLIVDARNSWESMIGKFSNAITPELESFRDWPDVVESLKGNEDKPIVTYCTGGIRCEKASAYLKEKGFKNVYQLDGGIINYTKKYPDTYWEGSIFVFDERRIVEPNSDESLRHIGKCFYCGTPASYYINCHNQNCDRLLISCHDCKVENEYCCSDECRESSNKRKSFHG